MKRKLQFLTILCFPAFFHAQMTLERTEMLAFGSVMTMKAIDNIDAIDTSIQGPNVVWNFSNLTVNSSLGDLIVEIVEPASTPYGSNFPTSNYAYKETPLAYRYFDLTNSKMERVGSYSSTGLLKTYSDNQIEYVFPTVYGTVSNDTWMNDASSFGGVYNLEIIGTGTLNLPSGTHNALMARVYLEDGFLTLTNYYWYSADDGSILIQYIPGDGFFVGPNARYLSGLTAGNEILENIGSFNMVNPISDVISCSFENNSGEQLFYHIFDLFGKEIAMGEVISSNKSSKIEAEVSNFKSGLYFLNITSANGEGFKTVKIIKK